MNKKRLIIIFAALVTAVQVFAQNDTHEPGLYVVSGDEYQLMTFTPGIDSNSSSNIIGIEIGKKQHSFKGEESGIKGTGSFVMVINPEAKVIKRTLKKYDPFINSMTPDNIIIVKLDVKNNKRIYSEGTNIEGINTERRDRMDFEWEMISDNSFRIEVKDLTAGEYAIVFRPSKLGAFDFSSIFGFTVE